MIRVIKNLLRRTGLSGGKGIFSPESLLDTDRSHFHIQNLECGFEASAHLSTCEMLFLNRLDEGDIRAIMEQTGLRDELGKKGHKKLLIDIEKDEAGRHTLSIFTRRAVPGNLLINIKMSEAHIIPGKSMKRRLGSRLDMISIDWASAHDPASHFTGKKPQLPGQSKPGLGLLSHLMKMMFAIGGKVTKDGFLAVPDHFHLAVMYSKAFRFLDPAAEGLLRAVVRDLSGIPMSDIAWGFTTGTLKNARTGMPLVYRPGEQVCPLTDTLKGYFESSWYTRRVEKTSRSLKVVMDMELMKTRRAELLEKKTHEEL